MNDIQSDIKEFGNLHPNRKLAVFGIVLFVFVASIIVGVYVSRSKDTMTSTGPTPSQSTPNENGSTKLVLVPSAESVNVGDTVTFSVMLSGDAVPAVDVVLNYDPSLLSVVEDDIVVGSSFKSIAYKSVANGKIIAAALTDYNDTSNIKTGEVMRVTMKALKAGPAEVSFDREKAVDPQMTLTSVGGFDTLQDAQNAAITIQ